MDSICVPLACRASHLLSYIRNYFLQVLGVPFVLTNDNVNSISVSTTNWLGVLETKRVGFWIDLAIAMVNFVRPVILFTNLGIIMDNSPLYQTIPTFNNPEKKTLWEKEKMLITKPKFSFTITFDLSAANTFTLDQSEICRLVKS